MRRIKIGTRASRLALWQAQFVASELKKFFPALRIVRKLLRMPMMKLNASAGTDAENFYTQAVKALFIDEVNSLAQN